MTVLEDRELRIRELDANRGRLAAEVRNLSDSLSRCDGLIEDGVYRFYHQSFKVATLYEAAQNALDILRRLSPAGTQLNPWFVAIAEEAQAAWTSPPDLAARNRNWPAAARPVVELAFHCDYFLRQLARTETQEYASLQVLPSGVAAVLELYGLR